MNLRFLGLTNGRLRRAKRAIRKLRALRFSDAEIVQVMQSCGPDTRLKPAGRPSQYRLDKDRRLQIAQDAILKMIVLGFDENEIADLAGVDHTTVAHTLASDGTRTVSQEIALAFRGALYRVGDQRLKKLLPHLQIQVLDTCCDKGRTVNEQVGVNLAEHIRTLIRRALILSSSPEPEVPGIRAFLAQIGDPKDWMYVFGAPLQENETADTAEARIKHLEMVEHELEHILQRFRTERQRLAKLLGRQKPVTAPNAGRIA